MAQERPPNLLQIFREPLKTGGEAEYKTIEDDTARVCAELNCPHPHLAVEPLTGPAEVWWLNGFESDAERQRVEEDYAKNRPLMAALERNSKRKQLVTGTPVNVYARYRSELSHGDTWKLAGARFLVVAVTRQDVAADASVFEAADGDRFLLVPARTREQADAQAARLGQEARVFAVRPYWGLPAKEWIEADPDFWKSNPLANRK
jgi:hypothetical protein